MITTLAILLIVPATGGALASYSTTASPAPARVSRARVYAFRLAPSSPGFFHGKAWPLSR